jgi:DNA-binding Lrp family transcriptional regulator
MVMAASRDRPGHVPACGAPHRRWRPVIAFDANACPSGQAGALRLAAYGSVADTNDDREGDMVQAYILVQTEVGKAADVATAIGLISGVTQADDVTGPYDVIVRAEAENVDDLGRLVVAQIQGVPGITRTLTCPIVHI